MADKISEDRVKEIFEQHIGEDGRFELTTVTLKDHEGAEEQGYFLMHPWKDPTLVLNVPTDETEATKLASVFGRVELPENYSAIFHKENNFLEVFWTAFKVRKKHEELAQRTFSFWWKGVQRECRFGSASADALTIAKNALPYAAASHTEHRSIMSFVQAAHDPEHHNMGDPMCFWVDCKDVEECDLDEYLRTINFYMTYYDRETPRVLIHEQGLKVNGSTRPRYVEGSFPTEVVAGNIDPAVASFWLGAFETRDPAMKYLLHYRLIEFLAMSHVNAEQRKELINILRRPHLIASTEGAAAEIAGLFSTKRGDTDRMKHFVQEAVGAEKVWAVLAMNKAEFSADSTFDGGYVAKSVLNDNSTFDTWQKGGPIGLVDRLRAVRNCLAHGQDEGTRGVIHTTQRNRRTLMPWVNLIETFAAESMLYSRRTYVKGDTT